MPEATLFGSIDEFRAAAKAEGGAPSDSRVRSAVDTEVKAGEGDSRTLTFTISSAAVDRMGDTIAVEGWKLDAYRKNPVVLWGHDGSSLPVGKATKIWIENGKLKAETEFTPAGMARFNDVVFEMYKAGFLSATSVGFRPLKYAFTEDPSRRYGIDFLEQELMEFSAVTVPANAEALIEGRSAGIDIGPMLEWAEQQLVKCGDASRVLRMAEGLIAAGDKDAKLLAWAERVAGKAEMALVPRERIERIERAAKAQRLADRRKREIEVIRLRQAI